MTEFGTLNLIVLGVYMIAMFGLGFLFMRGNRDTSAFYLGGGKLPWWALGISLFSTMLSAITFLSMPAKAYSSDWSMIFYNLGILLSAPIVICFFLPRFRQIHAVCAYEYFDKRFNRATRLFASGLFTLFMVTRIAIVLYLPALALGAATGMNVYLCILAVGLVTLAYSTIGGMRAVVWGDVVQGIVLSGGAVFTLVWLALHIDGGMGGMLRSAAADGKLEAFDLSLSLTKPTFWLVLIGGFTGSFISYTSDQTVVQRYLAGSQNESAKRSIWVNAAVALPLTVVFFMIGAGLYVFYKAKGAPPIGQPDEIYPWYIAHEFPPGAAGLLIAAIFSASMSTLSSNINSASAAVLSDFVLPYRPNLSQKARVAIGRTAGLAVGIAGIGLAVVLASWDIQSIWDQFNTFLGLFTGTLGALFLIGFFIPAINGIGALCGVLGSVTAMFVIKERFAAYTGEQLSFLLYGVIEIALCILIGLAVSLLFRGGKGSVRD